MDDGKVRIALIGLGTVGTGVAQILLEDSDRLLCRSGRQIELAKVVVRDVDKARDITLPAGVLTDNLDDVLKDDSITVVAQLVGGVDTAREIMTQLLSSGKDVVTANKALLASHGKQMFDCARGLGRSIAYEASVAGGIPIITSLGQSLAGNRIQSLIGILNGTCNYIITKMERGADYQVAVRDAQYLGYAEADPTMDVNGVDTVQKLSILAQLAFGVSVDWEDIPTDGIDRLETADMAFAKEMGFRIRLLARAEVHGDQLDLSVSPTLVRHGRPLADVRDAFNAISVEGDYVGPVFFRGQGAGREPTASAVMSDIIDSVVGRSQITFSSLQLWGDRPAAMSMREPHRSVCRFYLRFMVNDCPGVLSRISGILGEQGISISSVMQHEPTPDDEDEHTLPLVIMTYGANVGAMDEAIKRIDASGDVKAASIRMRVLD